MIIAEDGRLTGIPAEILNCLSNSFHHADGLAMTLSGALEGFGRVDADNRRLKGLVISHHCFYLSPSSWDGYFSSYISPDQMTSFIANHCYWLPGEQLCTTTMKMKHLKELGIRDTKMSLPHLARVLQVCREITKLDFSYPEKTWEDIQAVLKENGQCIDSFIQNFQKLTSLKIFTSFRDARDYLNDPWLVIIRMLTWCRDCVDVVIEITYTGEHFERDFFELMFSGNPNQDAEEELVRCLREELIPKLEWMKKSLESLMIIKRGPFGLPRRGLGSDNYENHRLVVQSLLLSHLIYWLFNDESLPQSLRNVWVQDFRLTPPNWRPLPVNFFKSAQIMKSFYVTGEENRWSPPEFTYEKKPDARFDSLENVAGIFLESFENSVGDLPTYLPNLKYCHISNLYLTGGSEKHLSQFLEAHPNLQHLFIEGFFVPTREMEFLKLETLSSFIIDCEDLDLIGEICPNIRVLRLRCYKFCPILVELSSMSSRIRFPQLNSFSLDGAAFDLKDGTFLLSMIEECPNLHTFHLDGTFEAETFLSNLKLFLEKATQLRDFRLKWNHGESSGFLVQLLNTLLASSSNLQRLALIGPNLVEGALYRTDPTEGTTTNSLVQFASKMTHLSCLLLVVCQLDPALIGEVKRKITAEILPARPSLWFSLGRQLPQATDLDVPSIHFHEMVDPVNYMLLPTF